MSNTFDIWSLLVKCQAVFKMHFDLYLYLLDSPLETEFDIYSKVGHSDLILVM